MKEGVFLKSKKLRIGAILLAMVIGTVVIAGVSFASSDQSNNTSVCDFYQSFVSKLAANLGLEQDEVTAALDATKKQVLEEAVQQGKITQEQADKISSRIERGFCGGFGFVNGNFKGKGNFKEQGDFKGFGFGRKSRNLDNVANALGMTTDELNAEIQSGKNIKQIVTEHGMTMEEFKEKMLELKKAEISQAVADGKITQEQADKFLQRFEK